MEICGCGQANSTGHGLNLAGVAKPSDALYKLLRLVHLSYAQELKLMNPFSPQNVIGNAELGEPVPFSITRGLVEGTAGGCYGFVSEGTLTRIQVPLNGGIQEGVQGERT